MYSPLYPISFRMIRFNTFRTRAWFEVDLNRVLVSGRSREATARRGMSDLVPGLHVFIRHPDYTTGYREAKTAGRNKTK